MVRAEEDNPIRCVACNTPLTFSIGQSSTYCWDCIAKSKQKFNVHDRDYDHSTISGVPLDGSPVSVEDWYDSSDDK